LDLRNGAYLLFNPVASAMWIRLVHEQMDDEAILVALHDLFDVETDRLRDDLEAFRRDCFEQKLLLEDKNDELPAKRSVRRRAGMFFPTLAAWWCLVSTARTLRRRGFSETYRLIVELAPSAQDRFEENRLAQAVAAFSRAENAFIPRNAPGDCLPRSLALFRFLRTMDLPAEHVIGVDRDPFLAHAWVECNGRVLLDQDRRAILTRLAPIAD
jgi:Transglutaminase-like superfamily